MNPPQRSVASPMVSMSVDDLVAFVGPTVGRYLTAD